ncbi:MAG: TraI domain-containing protein [Methylobacter sp.]|nr:TraI domain-containing protein [Methylobacter sp.]
MIKKIAAKFFGKNKQSPQNKLKLEKDDVDAKNEHIFDERSHRLPGFPEGIPVVSVELLINKNEEPIQQIILARGLSGAHNKVEVETKIMSPIRHLAAITHLLPASDKDHFKLPGGMFAFGLETALFSIRYAERRILTRATPEIRKEEESLWAHAAFLAGLYCDAIAAISRISVYADGVGIEWNPSMETLYDWLQTKNIKRYHIRWRAAEERGVMYVLASNAIKEQADILDKGERAIFNTLASALIDKKDHRNVLSNIVDKVSYKIQQREVWSDKDRYGKPLTGMHLEPWLIDAMRHLVEKKRWVPNEENGRIWHGQDGVFLVWPLAASDMQHQLKAAECPFLPNTHEILAEIMLDAGIIEKSRLGGYLFDIGIPVAESAEKKHVEALKFARYETLFAKNQHKPIDGNLRLSPEEEDEDEEAKVAKSESDENILAQEIASSNQIVEPSKKGVEIDSEEYVDDQEEGSNSNAIPESIAQTQKPEVEPDINILLGKPEAPVVEQKEVLNAPLEEDPEIEALFKGEPVSSVNLYDDDYAADYIPSERVGYQDIVPIIGNDKVLMFSDSTVDEIHKIQSETVPTITLKDTETSPKKSAVTPNAQKDTTPGNANGKPDKIAKKPKQETPEPTQKIKNGDGQSNQSSATPTSSKESEKRQATDPNPSADLLGELIGSSKSVQSELVKYPEANVEKTTEIEGLFGKVKTDINDQSGRSVMILNRLKRLPAEFLESRPGGITKVTGIGLKDTKLELKDCVSVLKAAGLLVLIDGYETGLDSTEKPKSRYFLVKADLLNGK